MCECLCVGVCDCLMKGARVGRGILQCSRHNSSSVCAHVCVCVNMCVCMRVHFCVNGWMNYGCVVPFTNGGYFPSLLRGLSTTIRDNKVAAMHHTNLEVQC